MATVEERIRELKDPNSFYFKSVEAFLLRVRAEADRGSYDIGASTTKVERRKVPYALKGDELVKLSREFGWKVESVPREFSRVPFVAAKIYCCGILNESIKSWSGEEVVHLEGDIGAIVAKKQTWKHVCRASVDSRALMRYAAQDEVLRRMMGGSSPEVALSAKNVLDVGSAQSRKVVCHQAAICTRDADSVLFDLARADISAKQAAMTAVQHSAVRCKVWFFFEVLMLYQDEGPLTSFPGRFYIDRAADKVYVVPDGPSGQDTIEYSWSNVLSYISRSTVEIEGGSFLLEIHDSVPGVYFVCVSDARGQCEYTVNSDHRLFHEAGETGVEVTQRMVMPKTARSQDGSQLVTVRLPTDMWEKVVARLMAVRETKLTLAEAKIAVADYSQQRVNVGAIIQAPRHLPFDVPEVFARAAWKKAVVERTRMALESQLARAGVEAKWDSPLRRLLASGIRMMYETGATIGEFLLDGVRSLGSFSAELSDFDVSVKVARTEDLASEVVPQLPVRMRTGYPGACAIDVASLTDASERREEVRAHAMEVFEMIKGFGSISSEAVDVGVVAVGNEKDGATVVVSTEVERQWQAHKLSDQREELVDKMTLRYDAGGVRPVARVHEEFVGRKMPVCTTEVCTEDPVNVLQQEYVETMPALSGYNSSITPYLFGEADKSFDFDVARLDSNARRDLLPRSMLVRRSRLSTACTGRRAPTQSEAMLAFTKRVANAPVLAADVVYAERLAADFKKFEEVALRDGWRDRMRDAVSGGLWHLDADAMRKHVEKLETTAVGKMIAEQFRVGNIDMTRWVAMVKPVAKPKVSESVAAVYSPPQTIIYQESKMTNSFFSPILSKFLDFLDQELLPWIRINARRDKADDERWANSMQFRSLGVDFQDVEVDITQCDKSQCLYNMLLFYYILEQFGAPEELTSVWKVMIGLKRASASDIGMAVSYVYQVLSGFFGTIAANTLITAVANIVCMDLRRDDVCRAEFRGDDGALRVKKKVEGVLVAERFANRFNMEAKVFIDAPLYFCSLYEVEVDGYLFRVRDPEKIRESLGRFVSSSVQLDEMYESFRDSATHYEKREVLDALAIAVEKRTGTRMRGSLRAISSLMQRKDLFFDSYVESLEQIG